MAPIPKPSQEVAAILDSQKNWKGELLKELRKAILQAEPGLTEAVKWKMPSKPLGSISWETNGIVCVQDYLKSAVRLTFNHGAQVKDPKKIFNCRLDSKDARGIDFKEGDKIDMEALQKIISAVVKINTTLKSKK